jgi:hypothetical protein
MVRNKLLTQKEVRARFCGLSTKVMENKFDLIEPADCFCGGNPMLDPSGYQFSAQVMQFIEQAVDEKLAKEGGNAQD